MPNVGIIIPTRGNVPLFKNCVRSIKEKTAHNSLVFYIADTGSTKEELDEIYIFLKENFNKEEVTFIRYNWYRFGKINNDVVFNHVSNDIDLLLFCNNDIELIDDCITPMIEQVKKNGIGTVGCKLLFADGRIQHAGQKFYMTLNNSNIPFMVTHRGLHEDGNKYSETLKVFGNTCGFCMIKKKTFLDIGGFNEKYRECFEDVELNVQCLLLGLDNIYLGGVKAFHYESSTRKLNKNIDFQMQKDFMEILFPFLVKAYKKIGNRLVL